MMRQRSVRSFPNHLTRGLLAIVLVALSGTFQLGRADDIQVSENHGVARLMHAGKILLEYQTAPHPYKVYVSKLTTPNGVQILRDSPHDHVHHHALMYAIGIDKVDFWEEVGPDQDGKQIPRKTGTQSTAKHGKTAARVEQTIDWVAPSGESLAAEMRAVTAHFGTVPDATLISWCTTLKPASGHRPAELWGRHYFGLGMRFVVPMDTNGEFFNPTGKEGDTVRGSEKLVRANWCAYSASVDGKRVTVAMFDHPENPRHPATWFTMTTPFAYLAATLALEKTPMVITATKPLRVDYGVALWDGRASAEQVQHAYEAWLKLPRAVQE